MFSLNLLNLTSECRPRRQVRVPRDLLRFQGLPMRVRYRPAADAARAAGGASAAAPAEVSEVLELLSFDAAAGVASWKVADVRANRGALKKGQPLNKKTRERRIATPLAELLQVNLHIDV
jgi:hypothetical protein